LAVALPGCTKKPDADPFAQLPSYRDQSVIIASKAIFDPVRYGGKWYQIARFPVPSEVGCAGATAEFAARDDGVLAVRNTCRNPDGSLQSQTDGTAELVGPGRLKLQLGPVPYVAADYWVLWVDEGYRTAVVGTPNGRAGWILNRDPRIPADRLQAAREILDFNGYDVSRLEEVPQ
jgi:apolipoprotein D and lipocalin family protein